MKEKINSNIAIAILARDCNKALERNIPKVDQLRSCFAKSCVIVVENDSKDGTKQTLHKWQANSSNIHLIMHDFGVQTIPQPSIENPHPATSLHRITKMAKYRNMYMDFINEHVELNPNYLVVIDIDVDDFSVQGILNAIERAPADWGGIFALGLEYFTLLGLPIKGIMYDMFAYVHQPLKKTLSEDYMMMQKREAAKRVKKEVFSQCISGFGGLAIYKWEFVKNISYVALANDDPTIQALCEHIPFNTELSKVKSNYIYKDLKINYGKCSAKMFIHMLLPEKLFVCLNRFYKKMRNVC